MSESPKTFFLKIIQNVHHSVSYKNRKDLSTMNAEEITFKGCIGSSVTIINSGLHQLCMFMPSKF